MHRIIFRITASLSEPHPDGYDHVDMELHTHMPFIPAFGMNLAVAEDGDFFKVEEIYWKIDDPGIFEVFLESGEVDGRCHNREYLAKQGWKETD
jgi:hypothetical protein